MKKKKYLRPEAEEAHIDLLPLLGVSHRTIPVKPNPNKEEEDDEDDEEDDIDNLL